MEIESTSKGVTTFRHLIEGSDFEQWYLLSSDRHHDNPLSDWKMQKKHLDQAREKGAKVIDCGDFFCAMQGKYDRRSNKSKCRPEHQVDNYLDALVKTTSDWFNPYADIFAVIGQGNHETGIKKNHETDLTDRLISHLNLTNGTQIVNGYYHGWCRFMFSRDGGDRQTILLKYHHGSGGGGPSTKGVNRVLARAAFYPSADIVVGGHIHERWVVSQGQERMTPQGKPYIVEQYHVCIPTYKDEYSNQYENYHIENSRPPKPIGAWWLRFFYDNGIKFELIQAQ